MKLHLEATSVRFHSFIIKSEIIRNRERAQKILEQVNELIKSVSEVQE